MNIEGFHTLACLGCLRNVCSLSISWQILKNSTKLITLIKCTSEKYHLDHFKCYFLGIILFWIVWCYFISCVLFVIVSAIHSADSLTWRGYLSTTLNLVYVNGSESWWYAQDSEYKRGGRSWCFSDFFLCASKAVVSLLTASIYCMKNQRISFNYFWACFVFWLVY